jgi:hypothetical protein
VLADSARRNADRLVWIDVSDALFLELRVLNGGDVDLATDANRIINRTRDALATLQAAGKVKIRNTIKRRSPRVAAKIADEIWAALEAQTVTLSAAETRGRSSANYSPISSGSSSIAIVLLARSRRRSCRTFSARSWWHAAGSAQDRSANPRRDRRPGAFRERIAPRFLRRSVTDRLAIRTLDQRRLRAPRRQPPPQERHVPRRVRRDPDARAYHQPKRDEGKQHNAAAIRVARRRCNLIHAMLTTATPYDPSRSKTAAEAA